MYGLLTDGVLTYAPNPLKTADAEIFNPTDTQYAAAGYKQVVYSSQPESDEGSPAYYAEVWIENENEILQSWVEAQPPAEEPAAPTLEERMSAVEGAVMELAEVVAYG